MLAFVYMNFDFASDLCVIRVVVPVVLIGTKTYQHR